ncbi:hypothetical protein J1G42_13930 [Cellulomonas sp. zg-ZUI222]|uniref:hypothetical protein n=1 Tax=Cellulomonas wangleii TaxID=2816956 RepID=UPI001A953AC5|nr:hypothetical protein [Cellulomonas wangleii]MBO0921922.1 hypothetical protein [Cellulomonas wangleii]
MRDAVATANDGPAPDDDPLRDRFMHTTFDGALAVHVGGAVRSSRRRTPVSH